MTSTDQPAQPLDLDAIQQRSNLATPGPWTAGGEWIHPWELTLSATYPMIELDSTEQGAADAAFIAAARTDVPVLVAEIERLRAVTENLLNQLGDAADKLLALGWDDVAAQMEAGTYRPAHLA